MKRIAFIFLLSVACAYGEAPLPMVAVMPLEASDVSPGEVQLLGDAIGTKLQATGSFRVMERSQMEKILSEQGFQQSGACNGTECAVQVGQLLGIDRMVVGSMGKLGAAWVLNLRMVSVGTGEVLASSSRNQKGDMSDLLTELAPQAVADLTANATNKNAGASDTTEPKAEAGSSHAWVWWTLGGGLAVVGAGAAAAVLLMSNDDGGDPGVESSGTGNADDGVFKVRWQ